MTYWDRRQEEAPVSAPVERVVSPSGVVHQVWVAGDGWFRGACGRQLHGDAVEPTDLPVTCKKCLRRMT